MPRRRKLTTLRAILERLGKEGFAWKVHAFPEFEIAYISNPKAASTTIKRHLDHLTELSEPTGADGHKTGPNRLRSVLKTVKRDGVDLDKILVFSSVRHPVQRVVSGFNDKFSRETNVQSRFRERHGIADEEIIDWRCFADRLVSTPLNQLDPHWRPQHLNLMHGEIELAKIVRVETLDADLSGIFASKFPGRRLLRRKENPARTKLIDATALSFRDRLKLLRVYAVDLHLYNYGSTWERLLTLPDFWAYRRRPLRYRRQSLTERSLI